MKRQTDYYLKQLERGQLYQDFVYEILHRHGISTVAYGSRLFQQQIGENKARIEIKFDDRYAETGNLYIEIAEKSNSENIDYVISGIYRDCLEYVIGNYDILFRFATSILRRLHESKRYKDIEIPMKTSRGFLLPGFDARKFATAIYEPNCDTPMKEMIESTDALDREEARKAMTALVRTMRCDPRQGVLFES